MYLPPRGGSLGPELGWPCPCHPQATCLHKGKERGRGAPHRFRVHRAAARGRDLGATPGLWELTHSEPRAPHGPAYLGTGRDVLALLGGHGPEGVRLVSLARILEPRPVLARRGGGGKGQSTRVKRPPQRLGARSGRGGSHAGPAHRPHLHTSHTPACAWAPRPPD